MSRKPILLTGSHRSGSTWVGRMIAENSSVVYIREPFNISNPPGSGISSAKFDHWYTYVSDRNEDLFYEPIKRTINFSYGLGSALKERRNRKNSYKIYRDFLGVQQIQVPKQEALT